MDSLANFLFEVGMLSQNASQWLSVSGQRQ